MNTPDDGRVRCPRCGAEYEPQKPGGVCPACAFGEALSAPTAGGGASKLCLKDIPLPAGQGAAAKEVAADLAKTILVAGLVEEQPGARLGHYKLLQQIGEGGCGVVYMAEQEEPIRRRVALKVIKLGMDTKQVIARFEAERQALALMDHPNIAKVFDAGATETGRPYFVMELVRGIKITDYCDQNNLSTEQRLDLFMQVCHAIQHAHQKGIIHRDIKPSNVLVTLHDGVPVPKVIDFGIAKATGGQVLTDKTLFTAFEQFIGTPAYMSPEQAELSGLDIDTRSDIYALGVLLYELLTGKTPFDAKELVEAGLEGMRRIIREQEPSRPSTKISTLGAEEQTTIAKRRQVEPPRLIHQVRGDLDWVAMKTLEKDRTRRYETANGLAADLQRHLDNEPVVARPPSQMYRLQKLVRRNKLAFTAIAAVATALVLGAVVSAWQAVRATRAERAQSRMRVEAETARHDAEWAQQGEAREGYAVRLALAAAKIDRGEFNRAHEILESCPPHLRHWEWAYLAQICYFAPKVLERHHSPIRRLLFTRDGSRLVTDDGISGPHVWVVATGRSVAAADREATARLGLGVWVTAGPSLAVSDDGRQVIAAGSGAIATWDANNGSLLGVVDVRGQLAALSQDGRRVFSRNPTNTAPGYRMLDSRTGQILSSLPGSEYASNLFSVVKEPSSWVAANETLDARLQAVSPDGHWAVFRAPNQPVVGGIKTREQFLELIDSGLRWHWTICDMQSGQAVARLPESKASLEFATFSPDGTKLFTQATQLDESGAREILSTLWETTTGRPIHQLNKQLLPDTYCLLTSRGLFSDNGRRLLTREPGASRDDQVVVWDVDTGRRLASFTSPAAMITALAFSPDGTVAITAQSQIQVWDALNGKELTQLTGHLEAVRQAVFSPDGRFVASASNDKTARIWPLQPHRAEVNLAPDVQNVQDIGFTANGASVYAHELGIRQGSLASTLRIWEAETGRQVSRVESSNRWDRAVLTPDGGSLATLNPICFSNKASITEVQIWDVGSGQIRHRFQAEEIEVAPDGRLIIGKERTETSQGEESPTYNLKAWNATNGALLFSQKTASTMPAGVELLQDGRHAIVWNLNEIYDLMDLTQQRVVGSVKASVVGGSAAKCFFPEQRRLLCEDTGRSQSPDRHRELRLLDTRTGSEVASFEVGRIIPNSFHFTWKLGSVAPRGERFVILHDQEGNCRVWLWETDSGKHRELIGHSGAVNDAAFFPDGQRVVTVGQDRTMRLWESSTGRELLSVVHAGPVWHVAVSPDGRSILTVSTPGGMMIWKTPGWGGTVSEK